MKLELVPLPPPEILAAYDAIIPGGAERLLALLERQSGHRQQLEQRLVAGELQRAWWGLVAGFVVSMSFLGASVWLITTGSRIEGTILGTIDLAALVGIFVYGTVSRKTAAS